MYSRIFAIELAAGTAVRSVAEVDARKLSVAWRCCEMWKNWTDMGSVEDCGRTSVKDVKVSNSLLGEAQENANDIM